MKKEKILPKTLTEAADTFGSYAVLKLYFKQQLGVDVPMATIKQWFLRNKIPVRWGTMVRVIESRIDVVREVQISRFIGEERGKPPLKDEDDFKNPRLFKLFKRIGGPTKFCGIYNKEFNPLKKAPDLKTSSVYKWFHQGFVDLSPARAFLKRKFKATNEELGAWNEATNTKTDPRIFNGAEIEDLMG